MGRLEELSFAGLEPREVASALGTVARDRGLTVVASTDLRRVVVESCCVDVAMTLRPDTNDVDIEC